MPHAIRPSYFRSLSSSSQKDKPRLYLGLYPRCSGHGDCDSYHWTLLVGPATPVRKDLTKRFHLVHTGSHAFGEHSAQSSIFHEDDLSEIPSAQADLLVRITIAKVLDLQRVQKVLQNQRPKSGGKGISSQESCAQWTKNAIKALLSDSGCLKSLLDEEDWEEVEKTARDYCKYKRRDGRFSDTVDGNWNKDERNDGMSMEGHHDFTMQKPRKPECCKDIPTWEKKISLPVSASNEESMTWHAMSQATSRDCSSGLTTERPADVDREKVQKWTTPGPLPGFLYSLGNQVGWSWHASSKTQYMAIRDDYGVQELEGSDEEMEWTLERRGSVQPALTAP